MTEYRKGAHTVYDIKYHVVWVTKYRYQALRGEIAVRARDLIREICVAKEIVIIKGHLSPDHVHLMVSVPPHLSVSKMMQYLKGKWSYQLQREYPRKSNSFLTSLSKSLTSISLPLAKLLNHLQDRRDCSLGLINHDAVTALVRKELLTVSR